MNYIHSFVGAIMLVLKTNSVKDFFRLIIHIENIKKAALITAVFCAAALLAAILYGTRMEYPWYFSIIAFPVLIIGGGVEEIGWRGFLQPALEKKFPFPIATLMVSVIWFSWHLPLWLEPSSNHYGDSLIGFAFTIAVWAFAEASIYKATKSVMACALYHTFINTIGSVYNWNALFDTFPGQSGMIVYRCVVLVAAVILWFFTNRKEKQKVIPEKRSALLTQFSKN